jgi:hypothetical protein
MTDQNPTSETAAETGRAIGRGVVWAVIALLAVLAVASFFMLGPLGVVIALAVGFVLWLAWSAFGFAGPRAA